ncbi:MAG TPA: hypothetical protein VGK24_05770 [Candidatus Angelobacter sp.]|jgi:hypothetical protein
MTPEALDPQTTEEDQAEETTAEEVAGDDPLADNEELQGVVRDLAKHFGSVEKFSRRQEVIETRQQRFYDRSEQYIFWNNRMGVFIAVTGEGSSGGVMGADSSAEMPRYTNVYNIYTPYRESLVAPLIQNPAGVNFEPDDLMNPKDVRNAKVAEKYKQKIDRDNYRKKLQQEIGRFMVTDNRVVVYTRTVEEEGGDEDKPKKKQLMTAHGVLESKVVPLTAKDRKELVAAFLFDDPEINLAKEEYSDIADKITQGSAPVAEASFERIARLGVLQGTKAMLQAGDALKHLAARQYCWLRPAAFNHAPKKNIDELKGLFPKGIKVTFIGDVYAGSVNESMDDHLAIGWATAGDGMSRPSLGKKLVPLQDAFNDGMNQWHEANEYCIPEVIADQELFDIDAMQDRTAAPGGMEPVEVPQRYTDLSQAFHEISSQGAAPTLEAALQFIQGPLAQFISGAVATLIGDADPDNKTKGGIQMLRDAALGRMGLPWGQIQDLMAEAYRQGVNCAADDAEEGETFTFARSGRRAQQTSGETVNLSGLKEGSFRAVPNTDSSFPETTSAKRGTWLMLMDKAGSNPVLGETMSQPDNMELGQDLLGIDLVSPGVEARDKQLEEIAQMLKDPPIPPSMQVLEAAGTQNQALQPVIAQYVISLKQASQGKGAQASVPPKELWPLWKSSVDIQDEDFHNYEAQECQDWLSSPECRDQERAGNFGGVLNVRLHYRLHKAKVDEAQQDAQKPKPPGGSINFKDLPPSGKLQMAAQEGIKLTLQDVTGMPQELPQNGPLKDKG